MQITGTTHPHCLRLLSIPPQWLAIFSLFLLIPYYTKMFIIYIGRFILKLNYSTLTLWQLPSCSYKPPSYASYYPIFLVTLVFPSLVSLFLLLAYERLLFDCALPPPSRATTVSISPIPYFVPLFAL